MTSVSPADQLHHELARGLCLGEPTFASIVMPSLYRPSGNGCADRVPILGVTFLRIATTNKPGAIYPSNFCLFEFIFLKELLLWFVPSSIRRSIKWWPH